MKDDFDVDEKDEPHPISPIKPIVRVACFILLLAGSALAQTFSLSWDASTTAGVTYNLYRKDSPCSTAGTFNKVNTTPITGLTFTDTNAPVGKVCYVVRAVDADGVESVDSNSVSLPRPAAPTNLRNP